MSENMLKYIALISILGACATPSTTRDKITGISISSDDRLKEHVNQFFVDCKKYLSVTECSPAIDLRVSVKDLNGDTLGLCTIYHSPLRMVEIDTSVIGNYNEIIVLYHELFHCVTGSPHHDDSDDIMNSYENEETTIKIYNDWSEYVERVFIRG